MAKQNYKISYDDINLENIEVGMELPDYKELCNRLGIVAKPGGSSRVSQKKQLLQYLNYENIGRKKIKITEIYLIPRYVKDKREDGNNLVYRESFIGVLAGVLLKSKSNSALLSAGKLMEYLGFVNKNYKTCKNNTMAAAKKLKIPEENILDFYQMNNVKLINNIDSNLRHYEKEEYYNLTRGTAICIKDGEKQICRLATPYENEIILMCRDRIKTKLKIEKNSEIFLKQLWPEFNALMREALKEEGLDILYYFDSYYFILNRAKLKSVYFKDIKGKGTTVGKKKKEMNDLFKESALKSSKTRQKNAEMRLEEDKKGTGEKRSKYMINRDIMITDKSFEKNNKKLVNNLISLNANNIQLTFLEEELMTPFEGEDRI